MTDSWIDKLKEYFFSPHAHELNIDAAMSIKQNNIPKRLFKYRAFNNNSLDNLKNDAVWCSNASEFNDPYDSSICFAFDAEFMNSNLLEGLKILKEKDLLNGVSDDELKIIQDSTEPFKKLTNILAAKDDTIDDVMIERIDQFFNGYMAKEVKEMNSKFNQLLRNGYKICSFSENIGSLLLWSHYADEHRGFLIEYDFSVLPVTDIRCRFLWPVIYSERLFDASQYFKVAKNKENFNNLFAIIAAIHKAKDWQYEKEWRLVVIPFSANDPPHNFQVPTPKAIYIGAKMKDKDKKVIADIAKDKHITVYQMELSHTAYKMEPVQFR